MKNEQRNAPNDEAVSGAENIVNRLMATIAGDPESKPKPDGIHKRTGEKNSLNTRQRKLLAALVKAPDIQAACKETGVGRTTAHRWLKNPVFREELTRLRDDTLSDALSHIKMFTAQAIEQLVILMQSQDERLRRQACNDILSHALNVREKEGLDRRLQAVERQLGKRHW